jgi:hypothetical protein
VRTFRPVASGSVTSAMTARSRTRNSVNTAGARRRGALSRSQTPADHCGRKMARVVGPVNSRAVRSETPGAQPLAPGAAPPVVGRRSPALRPRTVRVPRPGRVRDGPLPVSERGHRNRGHRAVWCVAAAASRAGSVRRVLRRRDAVGNLLADQRRARHLRRIEAVAWQGGGVDPSSKRRTSDRRLTDGRRIMRDRRREEAPVAVERRSGEERRSGTPRRSGGSRRVSDVASERPRTWD